MRVQFHEIIFDVLNEPTITSLRIQTNINKADYTVDDVLSEVKASTEVTFYDDDDTITGVYPGYTKPIAVSVVFNDDIELLSVEVENADIGSQIQSLNKRIDVLEETYSETNPLIIEVPTINGNTTTHTDKRIKSDMTVLEVKDYYTGLDVEDIKVDLINGAIVLSNISHQTTLLITLI